MLEADEEFVLELLEEVLAWLEEDSIALTELLAEEELEADEENPLSDSEEKAELELELDLLLSEEELPF